MTTLTVETYARVLAHAACRRGARMAEILAELGIAAEDFHAAEPALREQLTQAWENRKGVTAMKFATALGDELTRLGPLGADGHRPKALASEPLPADARPREPDLPSYLQAAPPPVPIAPIMPVAPPPEPAPPPPVIHAPAPAELAPDSSLAGTTDMDLRALVAAVKRGEAALPFNPSEASTTSAQRLPPDRPTVELPSRPGLGGTMEADLSVIVASVKRGALPFGASQEPGPQSTAAPGSDVDFAQFPLETYASVAGALARGEQRDAVLAKHGLSADAYDRMAKAWAQRFQREPQMLARFQELARSNAATPRRTE